MINALDQSCSSTGRREVIDSEVTGVRLSVCLSVCMFVFREQNKVANSPTVFA